MKPLSISRTSIKLLDVWIQILNCDYSRFTFLLLIKSLFQIISLRLIKEVKEGSNLFIKSLGETVSDFLTSFRFVFNWNCVKAVRNSIHASITKLTVYVEIVHVVTAIKVAMNWVLMSFTVKEITFIITLIWSRASFIWHAADCTKVFMFTKRRTYSAY